jgi:hypothetical protein
MARVGYLLGPFRRQARQSTVSTNTVSSRLDDRFKFVSEQVQLLYADNLCPGAVEVL